MSNQMSLCSLDINLRMELRRAVSSENIKTLHEKLICCQIFINEAKTSVSNNFFRARVKMSHPSTAWDLEMMNRVQTNVHQHTDRILL